MLRIEDELKFDDLIYVLSHDLRSPARALGQYIDLFRALPGVSLPERGEHYLQRMQQVLKRMDALLDATLELSRSANQADAKPTSLPWPIARELASELGVPLRIEGPEHELRVDEDRMGHILRELLKNVRDHAGPDADASLSFVGSTLCLRDHGLGIAERHHHEIFLPFRPVPHPDTEHRGMGLALVSRHCRAAGGRIYIELPSAGGLVVCLELPLLGVE